MSPKLKTILKCGALLILTILVGVAVAAYTRPLERKPDPFKQELEATKQELEATRQELEEVSRDRLEHNQIVKETVVTIREKTVKTVRALDPDSLVISVDEFVGRWREH